MTRLGCEANDEGALEGGGANVPQCVLDPHKQSNEYGTQYGTTACISWSNTGMKLPSDFSEVWGWVFWAVKEECAVCRIGSQVSAATIQWMMEAWLP